MLRALWVDENNDAELDRIKPFGFTRLYFSARDTRVTDVFLSYYVKKGYKVGIYRDALWDGYPEPEKWADMLDADVKRLGNIAPRVLVDIERHDPGWVVKFLRRWRALQPTVPTAWTMEGYQGGWMVSIKPDILKAHIRLVPQCYMGNMTPYNVNEVIQDLVKRGFAFSTISPMHSAQALPIGWSGFVFRQGLLP